MRKSFVLALAVVVGIVIAARPREAKACGGPIVSGEVVAAALVVTGAYAGTTIGMGVYDLTAKDPSKGYGVAEAVVHTPLALAFGAGFVSELNNEYASRDSQIALGLFTALHTSLAIHGFYTAGKYRKPKQQRKDSIAPPPSMGPPGMVNVGPVSANVTLTPVSDGQRIGGGLGLAGTF